MAQARLTAMIMRDRLIPDAAERAAVQDLTGAGFASLAPDVQVRLAAQAYKACEAVFDLGDPDVAHAFTAITAGYAEHAPGHRDVQELHRAVLLLVFGRAGMDGDWTRADAVLEDLRAFCLREPREAEAVEALVHVLAVRAEEARKVGDVVRYHALADELRALQRDAPGRP